MLRFSLIISIFLFFRPGIDAQQLNQYDYEQLDHYNSKEIRSHFDSLWHTTSELQFITRLKSILDYAKTSGNAKLEILTYRYLGEFYRMQSNHTESNKYLREGLELARKNNLPDLEAHMNMVYGGLMNQINKKDEALQHFLEAYSIYRKINPVQAANTQYTIANLNYSIGDYEATVHHGHLALRAFKSIPYDSLRAIDKNNYMSQYNTLGIAFRELEIYDSAIYYFDKSYDLAERQNKEFWKSLINGNKSNIYVAKGNYDKALQLIKEDFITSKAFEEWKSAVGACLAIGDIYVKKGMLEMAGKYYDSAKLIIEKRNVDQLNLRYLRNMSNWYKEKGDYQKAYELHLRYINTRDSIEEIRNSAELAKIKAAYDFDNQVAEIALLTKNNELQQNAIEKRNIIITASILLLMLIVLMVVFMYRNLKRNRLANLKLQRQKNQIESQNEELATQSELLSEKNRTIQSINESLELTVKNRTRKLQEINKELDTFLYRASHDIRQPIATILGLANLARQYSEDKGLKEILDRLSNTGKGMDNMLAKLRMLYNLNHGEEERHQVDIKQIVDETIKSYEDTIKNDGISVTNEMDHTSLVTNPSLLSIIFKNVLENALVFCNEGQKPVIKIYSSRNKNRAVVTIEDQGCGIEPQHLEIIFNAYFKGNERSKGNGLGLFLAQKAAETLNIKITVESTLGQGSKFSIHIPFNNDSVNESI